MKGYLVLVCVLACGFVECGQAPVVTPCRETDTHCLKASAEELLPVLAAGVPEFGIATMDPMHVDRVKTSQAGLDMDFRNTTVKGLKHCKILSLKRSHSRTYLDLKCSVNMVGDYKLGGQLLTMPIVGSGRYAIKIRDIVVKILFELGEKTVYGEKYWTVDSWKYNSEVLKGVHFQFDNLFNGNTEFSNAVHRFANENWREIFQEVAPPIVKAIVGQILHETSKLFDNIPINKLVIQ